MASTAKRSTVAGSVVAAGPRNADIASRLDEVAALLETQAANPYRVEAYRRAAAMLRALPRSVADIAARQGLAGLETLPGVGASLARTIYQLATTGRLPMLARLRGESDPVELLASMPGIGKVTAQRIHDALAVDTLEELEAAAHDGRVTAAVGIRGKRLAGLRDALASRLGKVRGAGSLASAPLPVAEILAIDREYRAAARAGALPTIVPRRFNPEQKAWLPVMHVVHGERHYTALFSNTARAHSAGMTRDWVIVYADGPARERQFTVVTASHGPLEGQRVVRGREAECLAYYAGTRRDAAVPAVRHA